MTAKRFGVTPELPKGWVDIIDTDNDRTLCNIRIEYANNMIKLLNELHEENQSVIKWIDNKIEEIKPYNSELCRATLLELKELLE